MFIPSRFNYEKIRIIILNEKKIFLLFLIIFFFQLNSGELYSESIQEKKDEEVLQYEVTVTLKLIQVYVTDKKGNPVTDLTQSDFELYDNEKLVKITDFEKHILSLPGKKEEEIKPAITPEMPSRMNRKFLLFFDFAFNDEQGIMRSKKAALHFIDTQLHPTDEVGVLSFSAKKGLTLHEYLTKDHKKVREVVDAFEAREVLGRAEDVRGRYWDEVEETAKIQGAEQFVRMAKQARDFDRRIYKRQASNFSSEIRELAKALRYVPGSKHIIFFSGGVANFVLYGRRLASDVYSLEERYGDISLRTMFEGMSKELAAANSPVYVVNAAGLISAHFKDRDMMGDHSLNQLAKLSGGKYFDNIVSYEKVMGEIQNITSAYYVLGYYIDEKWDGKYHRIEVKIKRKGCQIHGQVGYFNPKPFTEYTEFEKLLHLIDLALSEKPHLQEPLHFSSIALPFSIKQKPDLVILSKIPGEIAKEVLGREVEVVTLIFDGQNNIVDLKTEKVSASKLTQNAVYYYSTLSLSPGEYDCRIVIRNLETGKGAVGSSSVTIPRPPESGFSLLPPVFFVHKERPHSLGGMPVLSSFGLTDYVPVVDGLIQKPESLIAYLNIFTGAVTEPEIRLWVQVFHLPSENEVSISSSIIRQMKERENQIFLVEILLDDLQPGKYLLNIIAEELKGGSKSQIASEIEVR